MKLLADANISRLMVAHLRAIGHDVVQEEVLSPRMADWDILRLAAAEQRIVLTADKDFGELVFRQHLACAGVVLLRLSLPAERERLDLLAPLWPSILNSAAGHFVVVTERLVRRTRLPAE